MATGPAPQVVLKSMPFTIQRDKLVGFCYYRPSALSNLAIVTENGRGIREKVFNTQALTSRSEQHSWICDDKILLSEGSYEGVGEGRRVVWLNVGGM